MMAAGFVHGVLNTDNINITGESFDYGPYRFAPTFDPAFTAAYFDHHGLYSYGRQPEALQWNVYQLAGALRLVAPTEALAPALRAFPERYAVAFDAALLARLGVRSHGDDAALTERSWQRWSPAARRSTASGSTGAVGSCGGRRRRMMAGVGAVPVGGGGICADDDARPSILERCRTVRNADRRDRGDLGENCGGGRLGGVRRKDRCDSPDERGDAGVKRGHCRSPGSDRWDSRLG